MVEPSESGAYVGEAIVHADDVHGQILREARRSNTESGRTICGADRALDPLSRDFGSVSLQQCPRWGGALIHGGGGHDFSSPTHSLPDMANVLYTDVAASLVLGADQSDLMVEPRESDIKGARDAFERALGVPVREPGDVVAALDAGLIESPPRARARVRDALAPLFEEVPTNVDIDPVWVSDASASVVASATDSDASARTGNIARSLWSIGTDLFSVDPSEVEVNLIQVAISQIGGAFVLLLFLKLFGGSPASMISE